MYRVSVLQAMITIRAGGEPPRMSFTARKAAANRGPSHMSPASKTSSSAAPVASNSQQAAGQSLAAAHLASGAKSTPRQQPTGDPFSPPIDAPRQGVWYDGNPFEGSAQQHGRQQRRGGHKQSGAGPVAEGTEGDGNSTAAADVDIFGNATQEQAAPRPAAGMGAAAGSPAAGITSGRKFVGVKSAAESHMASAFAGKGSKGKAAAVGLLNKLSRAHPTL